MIPILIYYAIKKYRGTSTQSFKFAKFKKIAKRVIAILFLLAFTSNYGSNPYSPIVFNIVKSDKVIGTIKINKQVSGDSITYDLDSQIKAKFLLNFNITGKEKSIYKAGVLIYSSVFRTLNNKVKVNHHIALEGNHYNLQNDDKNVPLNLESIKQNLVTLYFNEPIGIKTIFCDNQKEMIQIIGLGQGKYQVEFSGGKHNIFHYKNGKCVKIEAISPMFDVILIPVQS